MKPALFIVPHCGYPFDVLVAVGASDLQVCKALLRKGVSLDTEAIEAIQLADTGLGRSAMLAGGQTVLRLREWRGTPDDHANLGHEVFHCVSFLMNRIGIRLSMDSDEAYAYAIGGLTQRILARLKKK